MDVLLGGETLRAETIEERRAGGLITVRQAGALPLRPRVVPAALARTIEGEIIPRLMLAHRRERADRDTEISTAEVAAFADLVLHGDSERALARVDDLERRGVATETVLLDLLAPTARLLGDYWISDTESFADVTIGLTRLHHVLNAVADRSGPREEIEPHCALLAPADREQHTFGLAIVATLLRRAGWSTQQEEGPAGVLRAVRRSRFDLVGLSASCEARLGALEGEIRAIRRASRNPGLRVLVGGPVFVARPDLARDVGADGTAADGRIACEVAAKLVAKRRSGS